MNASIVDFVGISSWVTPSSRAFSKKIKLSQALMVSAGPTEQAKGQKDV